MMQSDIDVLLNDLLASWHKWASRYRYGKGYPSSDVSCRPARASRQYDDENGSLDAAIEDDRMEAMDAAMNRVPQPYLTALQFQARNMATGARVWTSPRLPVDPMERARLTMQARTMLLRELSSDGVLG